MKVPNKNEFIRGIKEFEQREKRDAMYKVATFLVSYFWGKPSDMADGLGVLLLTWNQAFYRYGIFDFDKLERCLADNLQRLKNFRLKHISSLSDADEKEIGYLFDEFLKALQIDMIRFSDENKKKYTRSNLVGLLSKFGIKYKNSDDLGSLYDSIKDNPRIKNAVQFADKDTSNSRKNYIVIKISGLQIRERKTLESSGLIMRSPVAVTKALHLLAPNFFPLWDNKIAQAYECTYSKNPAEKYVSFCKIMKMVAYKVRNYTDNQNKSIPKLIDEYNYSKYTQGWI